MGIDRKYGKITAERGNVSHGGKGVPLNESDEPVFVLRAQDVLAVPTLARYRNFAASIERVEDQRDPEFFKLLDKVIVTFQTWQAENPDSVKLPD